jgi:hypothetical protein
VRADPHPVALLGAWAGGSDIITAAPVRECEEPDATDPGDLDHEYTIEDGRTRAAEVSKRWFRFADTYGVEVGRGQDPVVILAVTVVLDAMAHPDR